LNHSNFLIADCGHGSFLWNVLAQQTVEVFIAAPFPAGKWSGKLGRALKLFINMRMPRKLFAVVKGQRLTLSSERLRGRRFFATPCLHCVVFAIGSGGVLAVLEFS
jgi:hypothetical protein